MDQDNDICVWDIRNLYCLQTIQSPKRNNGNYFHNLLVFSSRKFWAYG